jgi:ubiquinone/menaquinone biosynthesis C-methylase UbiE
MTLNLIEKLKCRIKYLFNNEHFRHDRIKEQLTQIDNGKKILDAGCGRQPYQKFCNHLEYFAQDFALYEKDKLHSFAEGSTKFEYGRLDYIGNIWNIAEKDNTFDIILCTEVLEHIPYPEKTLIEFYRLLKPGGQLLLTFPSNCLRHMDLYYFSSGYSDRYIEYFLPEIGFKIKYLKANGDYYKWIMVEIYRTITKNGVFSFFLLFPSLVYYYKKQLNPTLESISTLCMGYNVIAEKPNLLSIRD